MKPSAGSSDPVTNRPKLSTPVTTPLSCSADLVGQVVEQLDLVELALRLGGPLLAVAAVVAEDQQRLHVLLRRLARGEVARSAGGS